MYMSTPGAEAIKGRENVLVRKREVLAMSAQSQLSSVDEMVLTMRFFVQAQT